MMRPVVEFRKIGEMSYSKKKNAAESKSFKFLVIVLAVAAAIGIAVAVLTPPDLDANFCPIDKSKIQPHKVSMLIDITDKLSNQNKKIVNELLQDWVSSGVSSQKLSIYSLNTSNINEFEDIDTLCSPPNARLLAFSYGRQKADQRIGEFKKRLLDKIEQGSATKNTLNTSRILESVRQITNGPGWFPGSSRLILITDLIEKSDFADFYNAIPPKFSDWVLRPANQSLVNSMQMGKGDRVQVCQLLTEKPSFASRERAAEFWVELFRFKGVSEVVFTCNQIVRDK